MAHKVHKVVADKVRDALKLRQEGKTESEIADKLHVVLRQVQRYLSPKWRDDRFLGYLAKGNVEDAKGELVTLWPAANAGTEPCPNPPVRSVLNLEELGIPANLAPSMLALWTDTHDRSLHGRCYWWEHLIKLLADKVPFYLTRTLAFGLWYAHILDSQALKSVIDLFVKYRPWESDIHKKVYLAQVEGLLGKPLKETYTEKVSDPLFKLQALGIDEDFPPPPISWLRTSPDVYILEHDMAKILMMRMRGGKA